MGLADKSRETNQFLGFLGITGMSGEKPSKDSDEKRFNETVQRMLKTPPKTHENKKRKDGLPADSGAPSLPEED